ncbi:HD domain-containing protein [Psychrobacillus sp. NPDC096426]|uniref:HD domain-containing protein n=1 Tax=Psychrobacillus sp. NPDC096426 TaxID=3364491 RepID=UPI0037F2C8EF
MINEMKGMLTKRCKYLSTAEITQLQQAMEFAEQGHSGQTRATGEPYIIHPLEVCLILAEYKADLLSLICALLHDVVEDTAVSLSEIEQHFGKQVAFIVDGLTKFEKGTIEKEEYGAINTEKLLSTAIMDIRVAAIKLADRLHNMRTLAIKRIEKKIPYANETLLFFSPLAEKIGLYRIQEELEDLAFSYLNMPKYKRYKKIMEDYAKNYSTTLHKFIQKVQECDSNNVIIHTECRKPPLFKAYNLISEGHHIPNLFTIHVTTKTALSCYTALGIIHSIFEPIPDQFIDQIAIEQHPFLKYLITKVKINHQIIQVIIHDEKTQSFYKNGVFDNLQETDMQHLSEKLLGNSIHSVKSISNNSIAFCELISFELFQKEITVFTPKMDAIVLPANSNIIDFAYALDPSLASKMAFAKVNGKVQSLQTTLQNMDIVEIHTKNKITANAKWLLHVQTSKAVKEIMKVVDDC